MSPAKRSATPSAATADNRLPLKGRVGPVAGFPELACPAGACGGGVKGPPFAGEVPPLTVLVDEGGGRKAPVVAWVVADVVLEDVVLGTEEVVVDSDVGAIVDVVVVVVGSVVDDPVVGGAVVVT
jgi:hypothetical protein